MPRRRTHAVLVDESKQVDIENLGDCSERLKGNRPLDLASVLKKTVQPAFKKIGITGVGCILFVSAHGRNNADGDGRPPTHNPRLLHVTNRIFPAGWRRPICPAPIASSWMSPASTLRKANPNAVTLSFGPSRAGRLSLYAYRPLISPDLGARAWKYMKRMAGTTRLELATSAVTGSCGLVTNRNQRARTVAFGALNAP
jgi:hypothetical protein